MDECVCVCSSTVRRERSVEGNEDMISQVAAWMKRQRGKDNGGEFPYLTGSLMPLKPPSPSSLQKAAFDGVVITARACGDDGANQKTPTMLLEAIKIGP